MYILFLYITPLTYTARCPQAGVSPSDTLLVVDAMTGQEAAGLVKTFADAVDITGQWIAILLLVYMQ